MTSDPGRWQIAQLNVGRAVAQMDQPAMAGFVSRLDEINALSEASPGFVWRLKSDSGNATDIHVSDDPQFIVNLTVWRSIDDLHAFTYRSDHKTVFKRRHDWFERHHAPNMVLWWVPSGTTPTLDEALARLARLTADGPTPEAFTFKERFPWPGETAPGTDRVLETA
jgi:hypothetical protein